MAIIRYLRTNLTSLVGSSQGYAMKRVFLLDVVPGQ